MQRGIEINQSVSHPTADTPFGRGNVPGSLTPEHNDHHTRNLLILGGTGVGLTAAVALGINQAINSGQDHQPQPSLPGGIVKESNSPIPTLVQPGESIVIPTAKPTLAPTAEPTPTQAPTPEATEVPKPMNLASLLEMTPTKIDLSKIDENNQIIETAWNRFQQLQTEGKIDPKLPKYTLDQFKAKWNTCTSANNPADRQAACAGQINYMVRARDINNPLNIDPAVYPAVKLFLFEAETTLPEANKTQMLNDLKSIASQY